jgi:hypothetical protein
VLSEVLNGFQLYMFELGFHDDRVEPSDPSFLCSYSTVMLTHSHFRERGREPSRSIGTLKTMSVVCMMVAKER